MLCACHQISSSFIYRSTDSSIEANVVGNLLKPVPMQETLVSLAVSSETSDNGTNREMVQIFFSFLSLLGCCFPFVPFDLSQCAFLFFLSFFIAFSNLFSSEFGFNLYILIPFNFLAIRSEFSG